jgi:hypothetical protein
MNFKKSAIEMKRNLQDAMDLPHAFVKDQMVDINEPFVVRTSI